MMAKKKPVNKKPEPTADEAIQADVVALGKGIYHATFTPTWRTQIDCGIYNTLNGAQVAIEYTVGLGKETESRFDWQQVDAENWIATGHDGRVETNLPIAKIVRVVA